MVVILLKIAGVTYCSVASLYLLNEEKRLNKTKLLEWLVMRQTSIGINGRTGKIPDSCYCFWVIATSKILDSSDFFDENIILEFLMNCQNSLIVKVILTFREDLVNMRKI